jgi:16S rRNA A1518/A1519 N6-dimethyltransferase RsmA/KsgA/DIM1 with predicted DNA glycosylase/AP lyase activity
MISEIEVEGIGIMRHLNNWQIMAIRKTANPKRRAIAELAFGLGMTVRQFQALSISHQSAAREAHTRLYSPEAFSPPPKPQKAAVRLPQRYERVSAAEAAELGADLLRMKRKLPRGHFRRWVEDKSGITYTQAQRFMRAAKSPGGCSQARWGSRAMSP